MRSFVSCFAALLDHPGDTAEAGSSGFLSIGDGCGAFVLGHEVETGATVRVGPCLETCAVGVAAQSAADLRDTILKVELECSHNDKIKNYELFDIADLAVCIFGHPPAVLGFGGAVSGVIFAVGEHAGLRRSGVVDNSVYGVVVDETVLP